MPAITRLREFLDWRVSDSEERDISSSRTLASSFISQRLTQQVKESEMEGRDGRGGERKGIHLLSPLPSLSLSFPTSSGLWK